MRIYSEVKLWTLLLGYAAAFPLPAPAPGLRDLLRELISDDTAQSNVNAVSRDDITRYTNYANLAQASYCSAPILRAWKCGKACDDASGIQVYSAGGDDAKIPGYYVAYEPSAKSVILAHQGTNRRDLDSIMGAANVDRVRPKESDFPSSKAKGVEVHEGFLEAFEMTIQNKVNGKTVLESVQQIISERGATRVKVTGHSKGGAIAVLETLYLRAKLDPDISIEAVVFGLPRMGNQQFADYVDQTRGISIVRINNKEDPAPLLPPKTAGFRHPSGEVYISSAGVSACLGQEDARCANNILLPKALTRIGDHKGPYFGVTLGSESCSV